MSMIRFTGFRRERGDTKRRDAFWLRIPFSLGKALAFNFRLALGLAFEGWLALAFWFAFAFAFAFWFAFALWLIRSRRVQARCWFLQIGPHTLVWDLLPFGFALPALGHRASEAGQHHLTR